MANLRGHILIVLAVSSSLVAAVDRRQVMRTEELQHNSQLAHGDAIAISSHGVGQLLGSSKDASRQQPTMVAALPGTAANVQAAPMPMQYQQPQYQQPMAPRLVAAAPMVSQASAQPYMAAPAYAAQGQPMRVIMQPTQMQPVGYAPQMVPQMPQWAPQMVPQAMPQWAPQAAQVPQMVAQAVPQAAPQQLPQQAAQQAPAVPQAPALPAAAPPAVAPQVPPAAASTVPKVPVAPVAAAAAPAVVAAVPVAPPAAAASTPAAGAVEDEYEIMARRRIIVMVIILIVSLVAAVYILRHQTPARVQQGLGKLGFMLQQQRTSNFVRKEGEQSVDTATSRAHTSDASSVSSEEDPDQHSRRAPLTSCN